MILIKYFVLQNGIVTKYTWTIPLVTLVDLNTTWHLYTINDYGNRTFTIKLKQNDEGVYTNNSDDEGIVARFKSFKSFCAKLVKDVKDFFNFKHE
jgi:hypothetical protein